MVVKGLLLKRTSLLTKEYIITVKTLLLMPLMRFEAISDFIAYAVNEV